MREDSENRTQGGGTSSPLTDLSERVQGAADSGDAETGDVWDQLDSNRESEPSAWHQLESESRQAERPFPRARGSPTPGPAAIGVASPSVVVVHAVFTIAGFVAAGAIYLSTTLGLLPAHYWVFSLPLGVVGVIGLLPMVAWLAGWWSLDEF